MSEDKDKKDVNKDGVEDGSPESLQKVAEDFGSMLGGFFSGILDGFSKYNEKPKAKKEDDEDK